ncbi:efflux RND transporter periplasmic adaptor subunit [Patescibacteria group bacterium]|nr:efflux RND transporter periplasmic adaptor subunit [Patescibacteria group bacterium]
MKNKILAKANLIVFFVVLISVIAVIKILPPFLKGDASEKAKEVFPQAASSRIQAEGSVVSQNEAVLHFQTAGKLVYLPLKEGDRVYQGETIAQLDTYELKRELTEALNNYRSARDTFDQTRENSKTGVLQGSQEYSLDTLNKAGLSGQSQADVINNIVKRILDQNQASLDNSVIQVELANYALRLAVLTSPINGILTHEDVTVNGLNITPAASFTIEDPNSLVFRADVPENEIDYVSPGQKAIIQTSGGQTFTGVVSKIYPRQITLANGSKAYKADIASGGLVGKTQIGETGSVLINNVKGKDVILVPTWIVLNKSYLWVNDNGKPVLKKVIVGPEHGSFTEIESGLSGRDKIIENPKSIISNRYQVL